MAFRHGQWVKFTPTSACDGCHLTSDGLAVGIYQTSSAPTKVQYLSGGQIVTHDVPAKPDRVHVVHESGENHVGEDGDNVEIPADDLPDLQAANIQTDLPPGRARA